LRYWQSVRYVTGSRQEDDMGVIVKERRKGEWWLYISHNGKRKAKKVGHSETEARKASAKIQAKIVLNEFEIEKAPSAAVTFQQCAEVWLALPHFTPGGDPWKEATLESYKANLKNHIYPVIGGKPIDSIKRKDIKALFDQLALSGLSRPTLSLIKAPVRGVFKYAVDSEEIEINPADGLSIATRKRHPDIEPLTEEEADKLLAQAKLFMGGYYYPHFLCLLRTGIRLGELTALQWQDVDYDKRQMEIRRSSRRGRVTDTKNRKRRRVDMTPHLTETLKKWETEQKKQALKRGVALLNDAYVFATRKGDLLCQIALANALKRCLSAARLRQIRIHDLRHTYTTIRLLRGHNIGDVSYQLGHSGIFMTYDTYGHWVPGHFKSEVDELDRTQPDATPAQPKSTTSSNL
jgi:integrase